MTVGFSKNFLVDKRPDDVFDAINNICGWWTENMEGSSDALGDEFSVFFGDVHYSKQKLVECSRGRKVTWLITDSKLSFIDRKDEWTGTYVHFDLFEEDGKTRIHFIHAGLNPEIECYNACSAAWEDYLEHSLKPFIDQGKGNPALKGSKP